MSEWLFPYYLEVLGTLPSAVRENLTVIRRLDECSHQLSAAGDKNAVDLVKLTKTGDKPAKVSKSKKRKRATSSSDDAEALSKKLWRDHDGVMRMADLKVRLAMHTYDLLDNHIRRLDEDLKRFAAELQLDKDETAVPGGSSGQQEGGTSGRPRSSGSTDTTMDMKVDPNEPVYCYCRQVAFGEMVACDNPECSIELVKPPFFNPFNCCGLIAVSLTCGVYSQVVSFSVRWAYTSEPTKR